MRPRTTRVSADAGMRTLEPGARTGGAGRTTEAGVRTVEAGRAVEIGWSPN
ncbi:hypothetical protein [Brevibacterium marinum]|uniref:Uncharacterized protein n=1 Tax=Brevibacterium marinum TaxID=418643 RepID=A0A846S526_9MICO|nr:hypothetical protein [Brevibacterium marinum]NJC55957.1 hypothetical protein [Brevibacterium marinum]